jgi:anti-anti-sigma factor
LATDRRWTSPLEHLSTADQLRRALEHAVATDPKAVVDMSGVTFIDVVGIHALLAVAAGRNGAGLLTVLNAPRVASLLDMIGLGESSSIVIRDDGEARGR